MILPISIRFTTTECFRERRRYLTRFSLSSCKQRSFICITKQDRETKMGKVVYFDLETTGLNHRTQHSGVQIISIGAVTSRNQTFETYILPTCPISQRSSDIHGITLEDGELVDKDGYIIEEAQDPQDGLMDFMEWLEEVGCEYLVAHNNFRFDWIVLNKNLKRFRIDHPIMDDVVPIDSMIFAKNGKFTFFF